MLLSVLFLCRVKTKREKLDSVIPKEYSFPKVSYQSLHRATDGFSPSYIIGAGSFGTVYKGFLIIKVEAFMLLKCLTFNIMELPRVL